MSAVTVVLLPDPSWTDRDQVAAELVGRGVSVHVAPEVEVPAGVPDRVQASRRVALLAMALNSEAVTGPVTLVAHGDTANLLPALGYAQRAAHRLVHSYVLLDSPVPAPAQDWPDAPVWWVTGERLETTGADVSVTASKARLRGFEVFTGAPYVDVVELALG